MGKKKERDEKKKESRMIVLDPSEFFSSSLPFPSCTNSKPSVCFSLSPSLPPFLLMPVSRRNKCANDLMDCGHVCWLPLTVLAFVGLARVMVTSDFEPWSATWDHLRRVDMRAIGCNTVISTSTTNTTCSPVSLSCAEVDFASLDTKNGTLCWADGVVCGNTWHVTVLQERPTDRFPSSTTWPLSCVRHEEKYVCTYPDLIDASQPTPRDHVEHDANGKTFDVSYERAPRLCDHVVMQIVTHACTELTFVMALDTNQQARTEIRVCRTDDTSCLDASPPAPVEWFSPVSDPSRVQRESGQTGTDAAYLDTVLYVCLILIVFFLCVACLGASCKVQEPVHARELQIVVNDSDPVDRIAPASCSTPVDPSHRIEPDLEHQEEGRAVQPSDINVSNFKEDSDANDLCELEPGHCRSDAYV
jgi:hypothetical protein